MTPRPSCYNRPPYRDPTMVQDGWTDDGRRIMREIPQPMSKGCPQWGEFGEARRRGWNCEGCRWLPGALDGTWREG